MMRATELTGRHRNALLLGAFVILSFFAGLGSGPLFDVDEGAFTEATREMLVGGDYITTWLNGMPRFDKPILIYWLQLLSVKSFGLNEFAFRLPSAISGAVWAAATYLFVRRQRNDTEGFLAAALLVLSLQVTIIAKAAIADALLNCCLALSMFSIYRHFVDRSRVRVFMAFAAIGIGVLAKGPIAILIPTAVSFLFFLSMRDLKGWFRAVLNPAAIVLMLAIVLPWYILEYQAQGQAFIDGFFMKHNVGRFSGSMEGHSGSAFYYVPVVLAGILPATGLLFTALGRIRELVADPLSRFCLLWAGFVFIFFSLSGTKLPHYMIYGYTPLFIILGSELSRTRRTWPHALLPAMLLVVLAALPVVLPQATAGVQNLFVREQLAGLMAEMAASKFTVIMSAAAILCLSCQFVRPVPAYLRFILGGAVLTTAVNCCVMPMVARVMQEPVRQAALLARREGMKIVMWKVYYPSFLVYSESLVERRRPEAGDVVLTRIDHVGKLGNHEQLYEKYGIILARVSGKE